MGKAWRVKCDVCSKDYVAKNISIMCKDFKYRCPDCKKDWINQKQRIGKYAKLTVLPDICSDCPNKLENVHWKRICDDGKFRCVECSVRRNERLISEFYHQKKYGFSVAYADNLRENQPACAACKRIVPLHIDHNHKTGVVRELLCIGCNTTLGSLDEDIWRLEALIVYLRKHSNGPDARIYLKDISRTQSAVS